LSEWERLSERVMTNGDQDAIQPIIDHANRLI
jgi:hypothetical protein